jgi:hypothetical protein
VEVVAIGIVGVAPIALVLLYLVKAIRKLQPRPIELPPWQSQEPPGGDPSGDREPRRPLMPAHSGAVALPEPSDAEDELTGFEPHTATLAADPRHERLAG